MRRAGRPLTFFSLVALAWAAAAVPAAAHHPQGTSPGARAAAPAPAGPARLSLAPGDPAGPCTEPSARSQYVEGEGHDHLNIDQHQLACAIKQTAFDPLDKVLTRQEVLGEMDVKADVAAVAVTYPQGGILFFDVKDPANPKFLRRYRGAECEGLLIDVDCGAFVDLSADGKTAFLSVQQISVVPGRPPDPGEPAAIPGVDVVDVASGQIRARLPVNSIGGVHTSRSHVVPKEGSAPRRPGEYLFSVANGRGIAISQLVTTPAGTKALEPLTEIRIDEVHDMFLQDDPTTGRTYMYIASGFDTGFYVFDVTDPTAAKLLAEWDLTPQCEFDWYSHTIDVTTVAGRRYVTMPAELFDQGESAFSSGQQPDDDQKEGCGKIEGNGDKVGPLWIVDATDFSKLGPADERDNNSEEATTDAALKRNSEAALVTTWTNAAGRPGQNINFSPHNQQIIGNRIYVSGYHSGVTVLDATAAFQGKKERPFETGFVVPSGKPTRPIFKPAAEPVVLEFFTQFINFRPLIWDQYFYKGNILAADMVGGFYSFREDVPPPPGPGSLPPQGSQDGPPIDFGKAGRQFFVSHRPVRARRGRLKIQVVCLSQVRCDGVMRLKSRLRSGRTGRLRTVRLGAKRFTAEPARRTTVTLRIPPKGRRALSRRRRHRSSLVTKLVPDVNGQPALVKRKSLLVFRPR